MTNHFNKEFNDFYNYKKGVVWEKIPGYGYVTMEPTDELNFSISQLSNYHKEKICDIIISMICINRETTKLDMYRLFQYSKVAGCSEIVNAKFISKIGHFPDTKEWKQTKHIPSSDFRIFHPFLRAIAKDFIGSFIFLYS